MIKRSKTKGNSQKSKHPQKISRKRSSGHDRSGIVRETQSVYATNSRTGENRSLDESWDFRNSNTKEYTHCFHSYPAMMIPQVARRILEKFGKKAHLLFDPYCGTGTSLVEANLRGIDAIGTDLNPLARLIATAKTTRIDVQVLDLFLHDFADYLFSIGFQADTGHSVVVPPVKNRDFWFSQCTQQKLALLLHYINKINDLAIRNFFKVAFSETVRESSFVKQGEFKLVRSKNHREAHEPDVFGIMLGKLSRNRRGMKEFLEACPRYARSSIYDFNTVSGIPSNVLPKESVDIVVTSPPYGDSRTTVAYGQYSRLANEWLGHNDAQQIDKRLMGGRRTNHPHRFNSEILNDVITTIQKRDVERARDVISFYQDYQQSIKNVSDVIKSGGFACYVVGNRTVKGLTIPNDEITARLFQDNGFVHLETIIRNIPNKRMPLRNSPSNIVGDTAPTIRNEYIVICQKN
jgi:DNA modification methylase